MLASGEKSIDLYYEEQRESKGPNIMFCKVSDPLLAAVPLKVTSGSWSVWPVPVA